MLPVIFPLFWKRNEKSCYLTISLSKLIFSSSNFLKAIFLQFLPLQQFFTFLSETHRFVKEDFEMLTIESNSFEHVLKSSLYGGFQYDRIMIEFKSSFRLFFVG